MIEIDIPSIDPMQHEPKIFFGMTMRQCICIVPGLLGGIALFMLLKDFSIDIAIVSLMLTIVPAVCMGWYKPYNMKFEEFLKLMWFNMFISNPKRIRMNEEAEELKSVATVNPERQSEQEDDKKSSGKNKKNKKEAS